MNEVFVNLVDLVESRIEHAKSIYFQKNKDDQSIAPDKFEGFDHLLKDFFILMNRMLRFGVIGYFGQYQYLQTLTKFALAAVEINTSNPSLTYILNCSRTIHEKKSLKKQSMLAPLFKNLPNIKNILASKEDTGPAQAEEENFRMLLLNPKSWR
jgi:hypothetical protein